MNKIIGVLLIMVLSQVHAENMKKIYQEGDNSWYIDTSSVQRLRETVKVRGLADFKRARTDDGVTYLSIRFFWTIDCAKLTWSLHELIAYSGNMGNGEVISKQENMNNSKAISNQGAGNEYLGALCTDNYNSLRKRPKSGPEAREIAKQLRKQIVQEDVAALEEKGRKGDTESLVTLGKMYLYGNKVDRNEGVGLGLLINAAAKGDAEAMYSMGDYYSGRNSKLSLEWMIKASSKGHKKAPHFIAGLYMKGAPSLQKDVILAAKWYLTGAERGNSSSQYSIGEMYENGSGVSKSKQKANYWYKKAADGGDFMAKARLSERAALSMGDSNSSPEVDSMGREIIRGPVRGGYYDNKHIISSSVGVDATYGGATITNSVIEAPVCVESSGMDLSIQNSELRCSICVRYTSKMVMNNILMSNSCSGTMISKPVF